MTRQEREAAEQRTYRRRPDMIVRSAEGTRWGEMGDRTTPEQRAMAVEMLLEKLDKVARARARARAERAPMHSPEVVVFDIYIPLPVVSYRCTHDPSWGAHMVRWTNPDPEFYGKPIAPLRPMGWRIYAFGRRLELYRLATVLHNEPDGADSGRVCKGMGGSELTWHNVRWAWAHRHHLQWQWRVLSKARRWWTDRCADCGRKFGYREARIGHMGSSDKLHMPCMQLRRTTLERDDARAYVRGDADWSARWRVKQAIGIKDI